MRRSLVVLLSVGLLIGMVAPPAVATVERVPVSGSYFFDELVDPGEEFQIGPMVFVRGLVLAADLAIDVNGDPINELGQGRLISTFYQHVNLVTGEGTTEGRSSFEVISSTHPESGWTGTFASIRGKEGVAGIGHGYGAFEGMQLKFIDRFGPHPAGDGHHFVGEILIPPSSG